MKIHDALNNAAFAQLYYQELGEEDITKEKAKKRFHALKKPDPKTVVAVLNRISLEVRRDTLKLPVPKILSS